ncbi:hypothetical protein BJY04DRAFT_212651 [Aspergillus karnatakaensis]|uniref:uncharacterized protein n=1 Tax=Aspergillus karnatakaensis TaxID=1810916 RepID=UPI003CCCADFA
MDLQDPVPATEAEAIAKIEEWYQAGRPLFTRDAMLRVRDQLREPTPGDRIRIEGFHGQVHDCRVKTGEISENYPIEYNQNGEPTLNREGELEKWVLKEPRIRYRSYDSMIDDMQRGYGLSWSYCTITIVHPMERCDLPLEVGDLDAGRQFFNAALQDWEASDTWKEIKGTLLSLALRHEIGNIIGMASGTFTASSRSGGSSRSAVQNAFLVTLKKLLQDSHLGTGHVDCYAQDPAYSQRDQTILAESDIQVVEDPDGFLHVDDTSLVFSCAPNICVKEVITDIARPTILIWCAVSDEPPTLSITDPDSPRVQEMIRTEYDRLPWPEDDGGNFTAMAIYVKKSARTSGT